MKACNLNAVPGTKPRKDNRQKRRYERAKWPGAPKLKAGLLGGNGSGGACRLTPSASASAYANVASMIRGPTLAGATAIKPAHSSEQVAKAFPPSSHPPQPSGIDACIAATGIEVFVCAACTPCSANPATRASVRNHAQMERDRSQDIQTGITGHCRHRKGVRRRVDRFDVQGCVVGCRRGRPRAEAPLHRRMLEGRRPLSGVRAFSWCHPGCSRCNEVSASSELSTIEPMSQVARAWDCGGSPLGSVRVPLLRIALQAGEGHAALTYRARD